MFGKIPPHAGLQRSIEPFDNTRLCFLVVRREVVEAVLLQQCLERTISKFQPFVGLQRRGFDIGQQLCKRRHQRRR